MYKYYYTWAEHQLIQTNAWWAITAVSQVSPTCRWTLKKNVTHLFFFENIMQENLENAFRFIVLEGKRAEQLRGNKWPRNLFGSCICVTYRGRWCVSSLFVLLLTTVHIVLYIIILLRATKQLWQHSNNLASQKYYTWVSSNAPLAARLH